MTQVAVQRYVGIGKETTFGTPVPALFHLDVVESSLDVPTDPNMIYKGGVSRFDRCQKPGAWIPQGGLTYAVDISTLYYVLYLMLGVIATVDNTTPQTDTIVTGVGETTAEQTMANTPIAYGSFQLEDTAVLKAHDDGAGRIVEDDTSGISGTINYITGEVVLQGLTASTTYDVDYASGQYEHTITPQDDTPLLPATFRVGKDVFEHVFAGSAISQIVLTVEREWATLAVDVLSSKDSKDTIVLESALLIPQECPVPFHQVEAWFADYGSALVDESANVERLVLTLGNNADAEGGISLADRYPKQIWAGEFSAMLELSLKFFDTDELEAFWGGTAGPSDDGSTEQVMRAVLNAGGASGFGDMTIDLPRAIFQEVGTQPSGRDRIIQTVRAQALWDFASQKIVEIVANTLSNY